MHGLWIYVQGDLVLNMSELVVEFVLKLALNAKKLSEVEIDPSDTYVAVIIIITTVLHTVTLCSPSLDDAPITNTCLGNVIVLFCYCRIVHNLPGGKSGRVTFSHGYVN